VKPSRGEGNSLSLLLEKKKKKRGDRAGRENTDRKNDLKTTWGGEDHGGIGKRGALSKSKKKREVEGTARGQEYLKEKVHLANACAVSVGRGRSQPPAETRREWLAQKES